MNWGFHPAAEAEHLDQVLFYESRRRGLGARYLAAFEATASRVCERPTAFQIERKPDIRRARIIGFPLALIYRVRTNRVEILAVSHSRRRPRFWHDRA